MGDFFFDFFIPPAILIFFVKGFVGEGVRGNVGKSWKSSSSSSSSSSVMISSSRSVDCCFFCCCWNCCCCCCCCCSCACLRISMNGVDDDDGRGGDLSRCSNAFPGWWGGGGAVTFNNDAIGPNIGTLFHDRAWCCKVYRRVVPHCSLSRWWWRGVARACILYHFACSKSRGATVAGEQLT